METYIRIIRPGVGGDAGRDMGDAQGGRRNHVVSTAGTSVSVAAGLNYITISGRV